jgi:MFS family permease
MTMVRNRYLILSSQFFSEIGDWVVFSAVMLQIYALTESPLLVSLIMVSENVAIILTSMFGGVLADRYSSKKLMIITDLLRAGLICLIPLAKGNIWMIYLVLMLIVMCGSIFHPAKMIVIRITSAFLGNGLTLLLLPYLSFPSVLAALFLLGVFQAMPNLVALTLCQKTVPANLLGRFFGVLNVFTTSFYVFGMLLGGLLSTWSIVWMYHGVGLLAISMFLLFFFNRKQLQGGAKHVLDRTAANTTLDN